MTGEDGKFRIAAAQAAPVFLDGPATIDKACDLIAAAAAQGARLVVFPEAFVPGYPDWVWSVPAREKALLNELYGALVAGAVTVPGPAIDKIAAAARKGGIHVVLGVSERNVEASGSSLYNTLVYVDAEGRVIGRHRKLVPTGGERLVWAPGDGSTLGVHDTALGRLGGLICWENYMPLARYALYAWGVQIYAAATWDCGEPWLSTLRHIAKEGRVFVVGCGMALRKDQIPDRYAFKRLYAADKEWVNVGDSAIVDPDGRFLAGPSRMKEEILCAEVDLGQTRGPRWILDVAGHYARPDVFQLSVQRAPRPFLRVLDEDPPEDEEKS